VSACLLLLEPGDEENLSEWLGWRPLLQSERLRQRVGGVVRTCELALYRVPLCGSLFFTQLSLLVSLGRTLAFVFLTNNRPRYRTSEAITFHCDVADVVALLCLSQSAGGGGQSRLASSAAVINAVGFGIGSGGSGGGGGGGGGYSGTELLTALAEPWLLDTRGDGGVDFFSVRPLRCFDHGPARGHADGLLCRAFLHLEYARGRQHTSAFLK